ncbi:Spo0B domain-containing protein [Ureibacillus manganicus]|uniref:SpoOB alpha-helical domain-containing protein n=1 Tax=Ureibacillus manganicus DSM 26584 TaxID=1384049 RepID=A0A0A3I546_9BACL|nr:Spo0B domain-containing protein [Ureibacillus manganicus]KGR78650.1 hypothetical protein CD29_09735 [Ureibacillus manganicus DSM 26584]
MKNKALTIVESLRYANHDFFNHLQLIHMNLELGRVEETKIMIKEISEAYKSFSTLNKLTLPKTVEWLYTFSFRFPAIYFTLNSSIEDTNNLQNDNEIVEYLEKAIQHVYDSLDPFVESQLAIDVHVKQDTFKLQFHLKGNWESNMTFPIELKKLKVKTYEKTQQSWKYELTSE